jgi:hypothetical protein
MLPASHHGFQTHDPSIGQSQIRWQLFVGLAGSWRNDIRRNRLFKEILAKARLRALTGGVVRGF